MSDHPTEWLSAYVDQELDAAEREQVERHLEQCESCLATVTDLIEMQAQIAHFYRQVEAPEDLEQTIMKVLDTETTSSTITRAGSAVIPLFGVAALIVLFSIYGSILVKLFSFVLQLVITAAYVMSHVIASVPALWIPVMGLAVGLTLISGLSLRRILRSSAQ